MTTTVLLTTVRELVLVEALGATAMARGAAEVV